MQNKIKLDLAPHHNTFVAEKAVDIIMLLISQVSMPGVCVAYATRSPHSLNHVVVWNGVFRQKNSSLHIYKSTVSRQIHIILYLDITIINIHKHGKISVK